MDVDKYIKKEFEDCYSVVFPNFRAFSTAKIEEVFSQFGRVRGVRIFGDERGYCFVRFGTIEESRRAVQGLSQNSDIRICPHRYRNTDDNEKKSGMGLNKKRSDTRRTISESETPDNASDIGNSERSKFKKGRTPSRNRSKQSSHAVSPSLKNLPTIGNMQKLSIANRISRHRIFPDEIKQGNDGVPNLVRKMDGVLTMKDVSRSKISDENVPALVDRNNKSIDEKTVKVLNASEVIVGNIQEQFSEAYILHLFERYEPLAIRRIQQDPSTKFRYCHVYFKKIEDAIDVERLFDGFDLSGKHLIVMRPSELMLMSVVNNQNRK